ncbi:hypothetical protein, partial [Salmonella enterica]
MLIKEKVKTRGWGDIPVWIKLIKKPAFWTAPQKLDTQLIKVQFFMAKPKYSLETRLAVVNHYLAGHDG